MYKYLTAVVVTVASTVLGYIGEQMISNQEEIKIEIAVMKEQIAQIQLQQQEIKIYFGIPKKLTYEKLENNPRGILDSRSIAGY